MPEQDQKIQSLETKISELEQRLTELTNNPVGTLTDPKSKDNISQIIQDKIHNIWWDKVFYHSTVFEAINRYLTGGSGTVTIASNGLIMDDTSGSATCFLQIDGDTILKPDKETYYSITLSIDDVSETNFDTLLLAGSSGGNCGFTIDEGTINAFSTDGTNTTTLNVGSVADGVAVLLEAVYYPGTRVDFFVDGTLKGTITEDLRSTTTDVEYIAYFNQDPDGGMGGAVTAITHYQILQRKD